MIAMKKLEWKDTHIKRPNRSGARAEKKARTEEQPPAGHMVVRAPAKCSVVYGSPCVLHLPIGEHTKVTNDHPVEVRQREPQPPGGWVVGVRGLGDPRRILRVSISYPCLALLYI